MTIKSEKTMQGLIHKDKIQEMLAEKPMTFNELFLSFDVPLQSMKNYIASLKLQKIIDYHPDDVANRVLRMRYIAVEGMPKFSLIIQEAWEKRKKGASVARAKRQAVVEEVKGKDYIRVISADDYHTKGSHQKTSAWIGTTLGTMEY